MKADAPVGGDERLPVLGGEDEMIMKAGVGGWHKAGRLAPLPGCVICLNGLSVVSLRSTTGYRLQSLRLGEAET